MRTQTHTYIYIYLRVCVKYVQPYQAYPQFKREQAASSAPRGHYETLWVSRWYLALMTFTMLLSYGYVDSQQVYMIQNYVDMLTSIVCQHTYTVHIYIYVYTL